MITARVKDKGPTQSATTLYCTCTGSVPPTNHKRPPTINPWVRIQARFGSEAGLIVPYLCQSSMILSADECAVRLAVLLGRQPGRARLRVAVASAT